MWVFRQLSDRRLSLPRVVRRGIDVDSFLVTFVILLDDGRWIRLQLDPTSVVAVVVAEASLSWWVVCSWYTQES